MNQMKVSRNIPNILSGYRLLSFPFLLYLALTSREDLFALLLVINLITDVLDGLIARAFNLQTEFGARLDSLADLGTYILAFLGISLFKSEIFTNYPISFYTFIGLFICSNLLSLFKFGKLPCLHLYSWKIGGYIQGLFFLVLFTHGLVEFLYYFMVFYGIIAFCEHIAVQLIISDMLPNAKGLYWVLKERRPSN